MKSERWSSEEGDVLYYLPSIDGEKDKLHREDGPACEFADGTKVWYYNGIKIDCQSQNEFERITKLLAFI